MASESAKPAVAETTPASANQVQTSAPHQSWVASGITVGALLLLAAKVILQLFYPSLKLDDVLSAGLLIVAVLPWISSMLSSAKLPGGWEFVFREIKEKQEKQEGILLTQQSQIQALRAAVRGIVTKHELDKLVGLSKDGPFLCTYSEDMFDELKRLRALSMIWHQDGTGVSQMAREHKDKDHQFDLKRYFYITEEGRNYLKIRGDVEV